MDREREKQELWLYVMEADNSIIEALITLLQNICEYDSTIAFKFGDELDQISREGTAKLMVAKKKLYDLMKGDYLV